MNFISVLGSLVVSVFMLPLITIVLGFGIFEGGIGIWNTVNILSTRKLKCWGSGIARPFRQKDYSID